MHLLTGLKEYMQRWGMMILPLKRFDTIFEATSIVSPPRHVKHSIVNFMSFSQKVCNLYLMNIYP